MGDSIDRIVIVVAATNDSYLPNWMSLWLCVNIGNGFMMVRNDQLMFNIAYERQTVIRFNDEWFVMTLNAKSNTDQNTVYASNEIYCVSINSALCIVLLVSYAFMYVNSR